MSFFTKMQILKPNCNKCGLHKRVITPKMEYSGLGEKGILIISGAPTEEEDTTGLHFSGSSGEILHKAFRPYGINVSRDCWTINAVNCRVIDEDGKSLDPKKYIDFCRPYLESVLQKLKPKKILLLGDDAVSAFYKGREGMALGECQGLRFWDSKYKAWVFPTFHPIHLLKMNKDRGLAMLFDKALKDVVSQSPEPIAKKFIPHRKIILFEEVIAYLEHVLLNEKLVVVDYETTGANVLIKGHKTACVGMATPKEAVAFLYQHPYYTKDQQKQIGTLLKQILRNRKIKKIVHNIQFEHTWSKYVIGQAMANIVWDTMLAAHMVDNRQGIVSLKHQAFQRWGVADYSSDITPFLVPPEGSHFNNVLKIPIDKLLEYNSLDCVYTWALYLEQQEELTEKEKEVAYQLFHKSAIIFSEMSYNGMQIDQQFYEQERKKLCSERDGLIQLINNSDEIRRFNKKYGGMFNMDSPPDVQKLLFEIMGLTSRKETKGGSASVDADVLSKIDHHITRNILKVRKLNKIIGTYIDGFHRQATDSFLHPQFMLHIARSFRSSSKNPNFQNCPKRDEQANKAVRSGMVPEPGCVIGELDLSGAEIVTSCTYHRDPTFINYQMDPDADMHRDAAATIWMAENLVSKPVRQGIKSGFVFSEFYGSYYVTCALKMYEEMLELELKNGVKLGDHIKAVDLLDFVFENGVTLKSKLASKGVNINDLSLYEKFEKRVQAFEQKFWEEWFPVYTKWKKDIYDSYVENGFIETYFGFRFRGYMDRKQAANYPIQGTSFHILLFILIKLDAELRKRGMKTKLVGQIHDSVVAQIPVDEINEYCEIAVSIIGNLQNDLPWLCIPMKAEIEISKTREEGGSFASMKKVVG